MPRAVTRNCAQIGRGSQASSSRVGGNLRVESGVNPRASAEFIGRLDGMEQLPHSTPIGDLPATTTPPPPRFALRRSRTDRMLGGVCGGLGRSLGADAALLRVLVVALTLITGGAAAVVYVAAWVLAPEDERPAV
jgi:phage shock protein C